MMHISKSITLARSRGPLPFRVQDIRTGAILEWDEEQLAYIHRPTAFTREFVWPTTVRASWYQRFRPAPPVQMDLVAT